MSKKNIETNPTANWKFGWPLLSRMEEFNKMTRGKSASPTYRVPDFQGRPIVLPTIMVPIGLPKYRISNGRTVSAQQEYVTIKKLDIDYFSTEDPELESVQRAQHEILTSMIADEGLEQKFKDHTQHQDQPLLLDENGFVVNGNRRLCCWRILSADEKYSHFRSLEVAVLPHCDEEEINRLEAKLQIERDIRSDYSWHAEANMYDLKMRQFKKTRKEIAALYNKSEREVASLIAKRDLAIEYLKSRGKENMWSEVADSNYAFDRLHSASKKLEKGADKNIFKDISFFLIDEPDEAGERLYTVIPEVQEHLSLVVEALQEEFSTDSEAEGPTEEGYFSDEDENVTQVAKNIALVDSICSSEENSQRAREIISQVLDEQKSLKKEKVKENYLFTTLKKALSNVNNASIHGIKYDCKRDGVSEQISQIRQRLNVIEKWLKENP